MFEGFRDPVLARRVAEKIRELASGHEVKVCHVCGMAPSPMGWPTQDA